MRTLGIVCEYNPFHLGHRRQLAIARARWPEAATVCLMSGYYVQRGEPAIFSRQVRAGAALATGADLVLELPVTVSLRSAEGFAAGAVEILTALGVEALCFGAETAQIQALMDTAQALLHPDLRQALRPYLDSGLSFPAARSLAAAELGANPSLLRQPNNILAVEYCKAILAQSSPMDPLAIHRPGDYHALEADRENPSATALRRKILAGEAFLDYVPEAARPFYANATPHHISFGERAILGRLRTMTGSDFEALPFGSEGLWRRFHRACVEKAALDEILEATKSKRYTRSRLNRMALCAFLGLTAEALETLPPYVRVLGFTPRGREALRSMDSGKLANAGQRMDAPWQQTENRCAALYGLFAPQPEPPVTPERVILSENL